MDACACIINGNTAQQVGTPSTSKTRTIKDQKGHYTPTEKQFRALKKNSVYQGQYSKNVNKYNFYCIYQYKIFLKTLLLALNQTR